MSLFELHAHTSECDIAAHATAAELVRLYHAAGYSGMVITDHYFSHFYEWFADELAGRSHREIMALFLTASTLIPLPSSLTSITTLLPS